MPSAHNYHPPAIREPARSLDVMLVLCPIDTRVLGPRFQIPSRHHSHKQLPHSDVGGSCEIARNTTSLARPGDLRRLPAALVVVPVVFVLVLRSSCLRITSRRRAVHLSARQAKSSGPAQWISSRGVFECHIKAWNGTSSKARP